MKAKGIEPEIESAILREINSPEDHKIEPLRPSKKDRIFGLYDRSDIDMLPGYTDPFDGFRSDLKTLDELLEKDNLREKDGFPRRIRIGKYVKPSKDDSGQIVVVPTTVEPKFYHDDSVTEEEDETGGSGEGEEGEVIGEQPAQPQEGRGEGQGAGEGGESDHDVSEQAFDLGKAITEKFNLPNLKKKGRKRAFAKYKYDLTDKNRGFGQVLDKKATMKKIIETNITLGRIKPGELVDAPNLLINPKDKIFRILSKEKDFESQAVVFFLRDYSGSMQGEPTEVVSKQHLFIYSWLMYQYGNNVETRFVLHDTEAKRVPDFYTYYRSQVAGGTRVAPAFKMVDEIVQEENLINDYNIYVFYGTDGDDWDSDGKETLETVRKILGYANRIGVTVAKNAWASANLTTVEKYFNNSNLLKDKPDLIKLDSLRAAEASEDRIMEGIRKLVEE